MVVVSFFFAAAACSSIDCAAQALKKEGLAGKKRPCRKKDGLSGKLEKPVWGQSLGNLIYQFALSFSVFLKKGQEFGKSRSGKRLYIS